MRDFLFPLVLILVVVSVVWIYFTETAPRGGPVATAPVSTESVTPAPPKVAPHPKAAIARVVAPPAPVQVEERPAAPAPPPIPTGTPDQVNVGMEVSKVVELLGEPDLTALKVNRGNLLETYVYKKKTSQNAAFIRLEDGRVVQPQ